MQDNGQVREGGKLSFNKQALLKGTWALCMVFTAVFILVAVIAADENEKSNDGFRAIGFAAIWTAFMMTAIMSLAAQIVFDGWRSPFVLGAVIGSSVMLAQMQFVFMIVYFVYAGHNVSGSDRALGSFSLFTMLSYLLLGGVLTWLQNDITGTNDSLTPEHEHMMDGTAEQRDSKGNSSTHQYSIDDEETDVVDVDLEETETF